MTMTHTVYCAAQAMSAPQDLQWKIQFAAAGVLLAVIGYSVGTIGAYCTGLGLRAVARSLGVDETMLQIVQPEQR